MRRAPLAARRVLHSVSHGFARLLTRLDPNDDPGAPPLTPTAMLALLAGIAVSLWFLVRWPIQPLQDLGLHAALVAIAADYGRPGSLYPSLYQPLDPLAGNSLLYSIGAPLARWLGVRPALHVALGVYLAATPLATLYALRRMGRSPWGAVLSVGLVYNMVFVAGFANMLLAAPLFVLSIPLLYHTLSRPRATSGLVTASLLVLLFLGHVHLYLWFGVLGLLLTVACCARRTLAAGTPRTRLVSSLRLAGVSLACAAPSLLLLARWLDRAFGAGRREGFITKPTGSLEAGLDPSFHPARDLFPNIARFGVDTVKGEQDLWLGALLLALLVAARALALRRALRPRHPAVLEAAFLVTLASYFVLPEGMKGHDVIGSRQISVALWLAPALLPGVAAGRAGRLLSAVGAASLAAAHLAVWGAAMVRFEREQDGLLWVMEAAPPRLRLLYITAQPTSRHFTWRPFWHVDKLLYMGDHLGHCADTPGLLSMSPIRYRAGADVVRIGSSSVNWSQLDAVWQSYDLVLTHRWTPVGDDREILRRRATLLRKAGTFRLYRIER